MSRAEPASLLLVGAAGAAARGRRWSRAASGVLELPRRRSLPHRAPQCLAAARRAGRAAGQSGRLPTLPRPYGVAGLRVGRGPGRRRGAPQKGLGCAGNTRGPGCRLRLGANPGSQGRGETAAGLSGVPAPFIPSLGKKCEPLQQRFSKWVRGGPHDLVTDFLSRTLCHGPEFLHFQMLIQVVTGPHFGDFPRGQGTSKTAGSLSGCI